MTADFMVPPHSIDAEQSVIGSVILDAQSDRVQKVFSFLTPEMFYNRQHRTIYGVMLDMNRANQTIDWQTVSGRLESMGEIDNVGGYAYLAEVSKNTPSTANVLAYANVVKDKYAERTAIEQANRILEVFYTPSSMTTAQKLEQFQSLAMQLDTKTKAGFSRGAVPFAEAFGRWVDVVDKRLDGDSSANGLTSGIPSLDAMLEPKRIVKGSLFVVGARPKMGKAMAMDAKILLSDGEWTTHGEIQVGQEIASVDGCRSVVTGVFPQGVRRMYQVTFEDGRVVKAADSHLWEILSSKFNGSRVVDTDKLADMLEKTRYQGRICVPAVSGDFGKNTQLIDGWVLGALLGDGSLTRGVKFTNSEDYILNRMANSISPLRFVKVAENDYVITNKKGCKNPLLERLRNFGLIGKTASQKEIPEFIFSSNKETRIGVMAGLLETDGWVEKFGCIRFSSSSKALAEGLVRLVRSLGGVARETLRSDIAYTYKGEVHQGLDAHMVSLRLPDSILARIESPRLRENLGVNRLGNRGVGIKSVIEILPEECLCIMVSHPSHLYVTNDYIVTHNTTLYLKMAIHCATEENLPAIMFSLEMPEEQIVERSVSQISGVSPSNFYLDGYDDNRFALASAKGLSLAENRNLYIDDTPGLSLAHIVSESRRIKRERGAVGMVLVDYLTLMKAEKAERNDLAYGIITKGLKALAKELNCVVVLLTQLNRDLEKRTNKRPLPSDSRDTGQIEQDCDYWLGIYREGAYDENANQQDTELLLRLNRHGETGVVYAEQRNGAIYDVDQATAKQAREQSQNEQPRRYAKKGGF
ncbi:hypothetical protein SOASR030_01900 [Leminorella grimontii]|uniref:DNA 5'-3' helicase n=1 Tax=Leminorella grimontii TaxID=82981 RepID=A0AAV5MXT8_9GAMM|nr:replicative DNA helicase [Leminorella grimontii ATCC 33999 = DSM 5078]GKX54078.1 hypothetical protein SOASR030_01900 [Leminorella grimontii]VFS60134.1 Replicative DNA helicase [Leminorella grimontii]